MVRGIAWAGVALSLAAAPAAAEPDWRRAGGALFVDPPSAGPQPPSDPVAPVRLPPGAQPFEREVGDAAARHRLDPKLLHALVAVERLPPRGGLCGRGRRPYPADAGHRPRARRG